jgi:hypothetical protein
MLVTAPVDVTCPVARPGIDIVTPIPDDAARGGRPGVYRVKGRMTKIVFEKSISVARAAVSYSIRESVLSRSGMSCQHR